MMGEQVVEFMRAHGRPIAISVISAVLTFASTWGAMQARQSSLEKRMEEEHQALIDMRADQRQALNDFVSRAEFTQFTQSLNGRLDDMRELLLQIKRQ